MNSPIALDNETLYARLVEFAKLLYTTGELDPYYAMISEATRGATEERALWLVALYTAYYDFTSAFYVWNRVDPLGVIPSEYAHLPIHNERRGLRGGKIHRHLRSYIDHSQQHGSQRGFLAQGLGDDPETNYLIFWETIQRIHQNGRYFAFKWAEILKVCFGWPLSAPDMRMQFCTGPKRGLERLYGLPPNAPIAEFNRCGADLRDRLTASGVPIQDWEELETILCGYEQLTTGRYYVGEDIDWMQREIHASPFLSQGEKNRLFEARRAALPHRSLGELNGWFGNDSRLLKLYPEFGVIFQREA